MGGEFLVGLSKQVRQDAGVQAGDEVEITLELDTGPRDAEVPPDLAAALDTDPAARDFFAGLAFTHRKEYARWITGSGTDATRQRRVGQAVELLRAGKTRS